jgi:hypothetical protein
VFFHVFLRGRPVSWAGLFCCRATHRWQKLRKKLRMQRGAHLLRARLVSQGGAFDCHSYVVVTHCPIGCDINRSASAVSRGHTSYIGEVQSNRRLTCAKQRAAPEIDFNARNLAGDLRVTLCYLRSIQSKPGRFPAISAPTPCPAKSKRRPQTPGRRLFGLSRLARSRVIMYLSISYPLRSVRECMYVWVRACISRNRR